MEKPDFERIIKALKLKESHKDKLKADWEEIQQGGDSYKFIRKPDKAKLKELLEENNLSEMFQDFFFLACLFKLDNEAMKIAIPHGEEESKGWGELLSSLKMLLNNASEVEIQIKHKNLNEKASIQSNKLISIISQSLLSHYIENDIYFLMGWVNPEDIEDWGEYISFIITERECQQKKKGRKKEHLLSGKIIDILQRYLQDNTEIRAEKGKHYSRQQGKFIYKFLDKIDYFPEELFWKEDNIRHHLESFRKKQKQNSKTIKAKLKESARIIHSKKEEIQSNLKDINKNK